jgi:hypothetical protein
MRMVLILVHFVDVIQVVARQNTGSLRERGAEATITATLTCR